MKIGITGQKGFLGSSVSEALSKQSHEVISLDDYTRRCAKENFTLNGCPDDLDWVFHFGASTSIERSFKTPFSTYSNNIESTLQALKIADRSKAVFLLMSSYVYGQPKYLPIDEKHPVASVNPYMGSKIVVEELSRHLCEILEIPLIILRGFNIYGDYCISGRLISDLLESVRKGAPMILNDPLPKRDYLYIKDFLSLIYKIFSQNPVKTGIFNVGSGISYSNSTVANMISEIAGIKTPVIVKNKSRIQDIPDCSVDVNLVKKRFSWSPVYSLGNGLRELLQSNSKR